MSLLQPTEKSQNIREYAGPRIIHSLKAKANAKRTTSEKIADWLTSTLGTMPFLVINMLWFAVWITINTHLIPGIEPFDPFPFGLLTMIVSLEAIILAIVVLISQNRGTQVDELREETDLQVDIITEQELTKVLQLVAKIAERNNIDITADKELQEMIKPINVTRIERILEKQVLDDSSKKHSQKD